MKSITWVAALVICLFSVCVRGVIDSNGGKGGGFKDNVIKVDFKQIHKIKKSTEEFELSENKQMEIMPVEKKGNVLKFSNFHTANKKGAYCWHACNTTIFRSEDLVKVSKNHEMLIFGKAVGRIFSQKVPQEIIDQMKQQAVALYGPIDENTQLALNNADDTKEVFCDYWDNQLGFCLENTPLAAMGKYIVSSSLVTFKFDSGNVAPILS